MRQTARNSIHPISVVFIFLSMIIPPIMFSSPLDILAMLIPLLIFLVYHQGLPKLKGYIFVFVFFFFVSFVVNFIFTNTGTTIIFQIDELPIIGGHKRLSLEMLMFTLTSSLRLLYIVIVFIFVSVMSSEDRMMSFFSRFLSNFPLLLSFTMRLIPKFSVDYSRLNHVFKLRGFNTIKNSSEKSKGIFTRIKNTFNTEFLLALIRTLLMNSLEDSLQYAEAMQSRGFGYSKHRSTFLKETFRFTDALFVILSVSYLFLSFVLVFSFGIGVKDIYPVYRLKYYINECEIFGILAISCVNVLIYTLSVLIKRKS